MNISSVVLHTHPERQHALLKQLGEVPGLEVQGVNPDGRLALTLECANTDSAVETYGKLQDIEGVFSLSLIYQYSDDIDSEEAEK
ncbi:MAG: chaperone NapD [Rhodocyclaceae bacterium]|nr:chaperone NapD [Rhodocyclaceae bacterium]